MIKFALKIKNGYLRKSLLNRYAPTSLDNATLFVSLQDASYHKELACRQYEKIEIKKINEVRKVEE